MFNYGIDKLTVKKALDISNGKLKARVNKAAKSKIRACHQEVLAIANQDKAVYGINTGFGPLCNTRISKKNTSQLQKNLLLSHSVGVGNPVSQEIAKLMLILKVHSLSQGFSGISMKIIDRILWHIKENIIPIVPEQGSVGASGDLAPLSHLFLPLIGEGKVFYKNKILSTANVLKKYKLKAIELPPKSGLALINGTQFIAAHAIKVVDTLYNCLSHADIIAAIMIEGLEGSRMPFHKVRCAVFHKFMVVPEMLGYI